MFHEMPLKPCFMKCSERKISQCILPFRKLKISFTEMFHESLKKQLNWNLMLRYIVKLTLN